MTQSAILKVIANQNPDIFEFVKGQLTVAPHLDTRILKHIYFRTHSLDTSYDSFYDNIAFIASGLLILSPESIMADCKVRNGVCSAMCELLGMTRHNFAYYTRRARDYYRLNLTFKKTVDVIVSRYK